MSINQYHPEQIYSLQHHAFNIDNDVQYHTTNDTAQRANDHHQSSDCVMTTFSSLCASETCDKFVNSKASPQHQHLTKYMRSHTSTMTTTKRQVRFYKLVQVFEIPDGSIIGNDIQAFDSERCASKSALKVSASELEIERHDHATKQMALDSSNKSDMLSILRKGDSMKKYNIRGKPDERFFYLSEDGTELIWKKNRRKKTSCIPLASVAGIVFGPNSQRFINFDWNNGKTWLCFSLICESRTVDIMCANKEQFQKWFLGLQMFIPLSYDFRTRASLNWLRAMYKVSQRAHRAKATQIDMWIRLVNDARQQIRSAREQTSSNIANGYIGRHESVASVPRFYKFQRNRGTSNIAPAA